MKSPGDAMPTVAEEEAGRVLVTMAIVLVGIAGIAIGSMKAVIIGTYVTDFGLRADQAGYLLSTEMIAATAGTVLSAFLPARKVLLAFLTALLIGDMGTALWSDPSTIYGWQVLAGLGHGFAMGRMAKAIAATTNPHRVSGIYTVSYLMLSSATTYFLPHLQTIFGSHALLILVGLTGPLAMLGLAWLPVQQSEPREKAGTGNAARSGSAIFVGLALLVYYISVGGYWPFMGRFANAAHIDSTARLHILGIANLIGLCGAMIAVVFGDRLGTVRPLVIFLGLQSVAIILLIVLGADLAGYRAAAWLYVFAWLGGFPYLLGLLSKMDPGGRLNAALYVAANAGYAIGPAASGLLIKAGAGEAQGLAYVQWGGLACQIIGVLMILAAAAGRLSRKVSES